LTLIVDTDNNVDSVKTTYQKLKKITGVPYLYRHQSGQYYGRKKYKGQKSPTLKALDTSDRKLAERKLAEWIKNQQGATSGDITLSGLCKKFLEQKAGNKAGTKQVYQWVINRLEAEYPHFHVPVMRVNNLEYSKFVAGLKLKPRGTNLFVETLGAILDVGIAGGYLLEQPLKTLKLRGIKLRKKVNRKPPQIPTDDQALKIIETMHNKGDENGPLCSSDFLKFLYLAGIGEAELRVLKWSDVDWKKEVIQIQRVKTGEYFDVPFYGWLKPFLVDLFNRRENKRGNIFKIKSVKQGIWNTCQKLAYPKFSPRNFRQACIVRALRAGVDFKEVALYQGHTDGGILISTTYSEVFSDDDAAYKKAQLAKTYPKPENPTNARSV